MRSPHKYTVLFDKETKAFRQLIVPNNIHLPATVGMIGGDTQEALLQQVIQAGVKIPEADTDKVVEKFDTREEGMAVVAQLRQLGVIVEPGDPAPEDEPEVTPTRTYEINLDDVDGAWSKWFNELLVSKSITESKFASDTGKPRITTTGEPKQVKEWVDAFKAAYPDYADLTYTQVS